MRTSIAPSELPTMSIAESVDPGSATSQGTSSNDPWLTAVYARSSTATVAPRSRSCAAVAAPMPLAPPVTTATSPSKSFMSLHPFGKSSDLQTRIDVDLGSPGCVLRSPSVEDVAGPIQADCGGHQRAGVDIPGRVSIDGSRQPLRRCQDADSRDVLEHHRARVDDTWCGGDADIDHAPARLDEVERECGKFRCVGRVDHRMPRELWQFASLPDPRK